MIGPLPFPIELVTPPPFGYRVGSLVRQEVRFHLPPGWRLEKGRLPQPGPVEEGIELRRIERRRGGLLLEYQLFLPLRERYRAELPAWTLFFLGPDGERHPYPIGAWSFSLSPLIPPDLADPEPGPLHRPPPVDLKTPKRRFFLSGLLTLLLSLGLLLRGWYRKRPLWGISRDLRRGELSLAFRKLHRLLSERAGFPLYRHNLERFLERFPSLEGRRGELLWFLERLERHLFAGEALEGEAGARLASLLKALRDGL